MEIENEEMITNNSPKKRGSRPLERREPLSRPERIKCMMCNQVKESDEYYDSDSDIHIAIGKIPYCKDCLCKLYDDYKIKYETNDIIFPERKAMERICMMCDVYYDDKMFSNAEKNKQKQIERNAKKRISLEPHILLLYFKSTKLHQYANKSYDDTAYKRYADEKELGYSVVGYAQVDKQEEENEIVAEGTRIFGSGFQEADYSYLLEQYKDWTTRHECNTKSQEEMFKQICFTQLEILKAKRTKQDTKDLNATLLKQMEAAKLQPKQNYGDTTADTQTFGTLIDKWENTRPIPEIDEELKDVDNIKKYINVFFRGHLAKMLGIDSGYSDEYEEYMEQYTVNKPEYDDDESGSAIYDAIFGSDEDVM